MFQKHSIIEFRCYIVDVFRAVAKKKKMFEKLIL